jgi:hypothetical protein
LAFFFAAFEIAEFFPGTTDDTTTFRTFRCARNSETTPRESFLVAIRAGAETRRLDANANFAYELLMSINK